MDRVQQIKDQFRLHYEIDVGEIDVHWSLEPVGEFGYEVVANMREPFAFHYNPDQIVEQTEFLDDEHFASYLVCIEFVSDLLFGHFIDDDPLKQAFEALRLVNPVMLSFFEQTQMTILDRKTAT